MMLTLGVSKKMLLQSKEEESKNTIVNTTEDELGYPSRIFLPGGQVKGYNALQANEMDSARSPDMH